MTELASLVLATVALTACLLAIARGSPLDRLRPMPAFDLTEAVGAGAFAVGLAGRAAGGSVLANVLC